MPHGSVRHQRVMNDLDGWLSALGLPGLRVASRLHG
jgi:hypothetical protein